MKIDAFDGLRGYLALWVVLEHTLWACGFPHGGTEDSASLVYLVLHGGIAVKVFMILSGFVVSRLLLTHDPAVAPFLVRRFFRIYPAYLLALAIGVLTLGSFRLTWASLPFKVTRHSIDLALFDYTAANLLPEVWRHLLLAQSLVRGDSAYAILGPAWSLSLDWQLYLLAPMVMVPLRRNPAVAAGAGILATVALEHLTGGNLLLVHFGVYFWVGTVTHLLLGNERLRHALAEMGSAHQALAVVAYLAASGAGMHHIVFAVWLGAVLAATSDASRRTWLVALLTHRAALGLGRISYSIFLMHMFCLLLALDLFGPFAAFGRSGYTLAVAITTLVTTTGVSTLTYLYVEKPGMALGKALAARMRPAGAVRGEA